MSSIGEDLPENWIRRESKSRPNQFYYFNTKTNVSQWKRPADATKNKKEKIPNSTTKRSKEKEFDESNRFKIGSKSKKGMSITIFIISISISFEFEIGFKFKEKIACHAFVLLHFHQFSEFE